MPWRRKFFLREEVTGKLKRWMDAFRIWYTEDVEDPRIDFDLYFRLVGTYYVTAFEHTWHQQGRRADTQELSARKLVAVTQRNAPVASRRAMLEAIDFIAERTDVSVIQEWEPDARAFARKQLASLD